MTFCILKSLMLPCNYMDINKWLSHTTRDLGGSFSPHRPGFDHKVVYVVFMVEKNALGKVSLCNSVFPCQLSSHQCSIFIYLSSLVGKTNTLLAIVARDLVLSQKNKTESMTSTLCLSTQTAVFYKVSLFWMYHIQLWKISDNLNKIGHIGRTWCSKSNTHYNTCCTLTTLV
jgi:hypothetical protein